jgi:hypothetical protein
MAAIANSPSFAKKAGVPQSVGKDFNEADKGRKFSKGGDTMASKMNPGFMAMMAKKKGAPTKKMAGGGSTESGGRGVTTVPGDKKLGSPPRYATKILPSGSKPLTEQRPEKEGSGFKRGGSASSRADGIAAKGKTKGKMLTKGGMAC